VDLRADLDAVAKRRISISAGSRTNTKKLQVVKQQCPGIKGSGPYSKFEVK